MLRRRMTRRLLGPEDIPPSQPGLEVVGVFNPGVVETDDGVVLLVRVAEAPRDLRHGYVGLPRWAGGQIVVDWVPEDEVRRVDPRVVELPRQGRVRLTSTSHLRVVTSRDGVVVDSIDGARLAPEGPTEVFGVEDPRITVLDGVFWITYVAVSEHGAATALASTRDFRVFERHGVIFCPENKDVVLFPERIGGRYVALHRPSPRTPFSAPAMWLAESDDLLTWGRHRPFLDGSEPWSLGRVGAGAPPLKTPEGWLHLYHGNDKRAGSAEGVVGTYSAGALLTALDEPHRVVRRSFGAILTPEAEHEREGFVPDVVFPTAVLERGDAYLVYLGAADTCVGVVELSKGELMARLVDGSGRG